MKRFSLIIWIGIFVASVSGLFHIKHTVQNLKRDIAEVQRQLDADKDAIHVLRAEWSYLNKPERLRHLAEKHLDVQPMQVAQIRSLDYPIIMAGLQDGQSPASLSDIKGFRERAIIAASVEDKNAVASIQAYPQRKPQYVPLKVTQ